MGSQKSSSRSVRPGRVARRVHGRWWIDDNGQSIDHARVGQDRDSRHVAFRYLGMIEVICKANTVHLQWDVVSVSNAAIIAAGFFLSKQKPGTHIILEFFWGAWNREYYAQTSEALLRITELETFRTVEPFKGIKRSLRPISDVRNEGTLIRQSFELWDRKQSFFAKGDPRSLGALASYA